MDPAQYAWSGPNYGPNRVWTQSCLNSTNAGKRPDPNSHTVRSLVPTSDRRYRARTDMSSRLCRPYTRTHPGAGQRLTLPAVRRTPTPNFCPLGDHDLEYIKERVLRNQVCVYSLLPNHSARISLTWVLGVFLQVSRREPPQEPRIRGRFLSTPTGSKVLEEHYVSTCIFL